MTAHNDLRPRGVILRAFGEEITMLGPNTLMTEHTHPFDLSFNLWSPTANDDRLPKGEYDFPFEFTLPAGLPPTFNGEFTRIIYLIEVKVDLPLHADIRHEQSLMIRPAPLTDAGLPIHAAVSTPGGLMLHLDLASSGFYPGDHISGTMRVVGAGAQSITAATIDLIAREKGEAREFADHVEKVRVRVEIDPAQLKSGQPFPFDLPIPEDVDPAFVAQHSSKSQLIRARLEIVSAQPLIAEAAIRIGSR